MVCPKCLASIEHSDKPCPICGWNNAAGSYVNKEAELIKFDPYAEAVPLDPRKKMFDITGSGTFLSMCILFSVGLFLSLFTGIVNVMLIPCLVGLWMMYSAAKKSDTAKMSKGLKVLKVTMRVQYIAAFVGVVLLLFAAIGVIGFGGNALVDYINEGLSTPAPEGVDPEEYEYALGVGAGFAGFLGGLGLMFLVGLLIGLSIYLLILNLIFGKTFLKCAKEASEDFDSGNPVDFNSHRLSVKLIILCVLSFTFNPLPLISMLSLAKYSSLISFLPLSQLISIVSLFIASRVAKRN